MSLDSDNEVIADLANRSALSKAPDHVHNMVAKWGKGTECVIEWGFRQDTVNYTSKGIVVGRTSRKGMVKVKISYNPAQGSKGPSGFLYLPHTNRIRICSIRATKLIKVETITRNLEEHADNVSSDENGQSDLEPLPTMVPIDSSFSIHVVAIFRAILRGYPSVELDSEKTAIWHKFLNAPRDSLATIRQLSRQNQRVGHINKQADPSENETLSIEQREELGVDRRSIKNALTTARAGNIGKATRILDNVYKVSNLTAHEKLQKLRDLHPEGPSIEIPEADFPRIGVVDKSELRLAVEKLARGASPGPSGLNESMMRLLVEDEEACLSLCHMIRDVINGDVPVSVRKRLTFLYLVWSLVFLYLVEFFYSFQFSCSNEFLLSTVKLCKRVTQPSPSERAKKSRMMTHCRSNVPRVSSERPRNHTLEVLDLLLWKLWTTLVLGGGKRSIVDPHGAPYTMFTKKVELSVPTARRASIRVKVRNVVQHPSTDPR